MRVQIQEKNLLVDRTSLEYYPYYFAIWKDASDHRVTVKRVLIQWAEALETLRTEGDVVYLPYYLDDQMCKYLKAQRIDSNVQLSDLLVAADGWALDLDDLSREIYSAPEVIDNYVDSDGNRVEYEPRVFGQFAIKDLIEALRIATIADA